MELTFILILVVFFVGARALSRVTSTPDPKAVDDSRVWPDAGHLLGLSWNARDQTLSGRSGELGVRVVP